VRRDPCGAMNDSLGRRGFLFLYLAVKKTVMANLIFGFG
jgi:hypothetical protein